MDRTIGDRLFFFFIFHLSWFYSGHAGSTMEEGCVSGGVCTLANAHNGIVTHRRAMDVNTRRHPAVSRVIVLTSCTLLAAGVLVALCKTSASGSAGCLTSLRFLSSRIARRSMCFRNVEARLFSIRVPPFCAGWHIRRG